MLSYVQNQVWNMEDGLLLVYEHRSSLDLDKSINVAENIQRDSTIMVIPVSSEFNFTDITTTTTLDEHIKSSGGEFFEERFVHQDLIGGSTEIKVGRTVQGQEYILSELGIWTFQKLFEMVHQIHNLDHCCLDGSFGYEHVRHLPLTHGYFIDPEHLEISKAVNFTPDGYEKDIGALGQVLQRVCEVKFMSSSGEVIYPAYVAHLLGIMKSMPAGAKNSHAFREFLRKHPCMMSPMERQGLILRAHTQTIFPPMVLQINKSMPASDDYAMWGHIAELIPEFEAVYNYRCPNGYSNSLMSWLQFCRNFLSHPTQDKKTPRFSMEDVDIALWYHFGELLAAALLCLAACQDVDEGGTWTKVTRK